jgi:hypothetical protein
METNKVVAELCAKGIDERSLFAMMALQAIITNPEVNSSNPWTAAKWAIEYADTLLKALEEDKGQAPA